MKVIKIGAVWCSDCVIMRPRWQEIEKENPWLKTEYLEYDDNKAEADKYLGEAKDIPLFVFLDKDGMVLEKLRGAVSKEILLEKINTYKNK